MDLGRSSSDRHEICTQGWRGAGLKIYFPKFFSMTLKCGGGKRQIFDDRRQSEAPDFETAQHIDAQ